MVNSARRPSSMENSTRRLSIVDNSTRQSSSVDRSARKSSRLHRRLKIAKRDWQQSIEKEVKDNLILQATLERRKQALQKRRLEYQEDVSSLQEQLQVEKDLRAALEVQDEKWRLEMDEEIEHKNTWVWYDLLKGSRPIDKNSFNDKSATNIKNPMSNKSAKENKFAVKMQKLRE